jgi:hypothetical protein
MRNFLRSMMLMSLAAIAYADTVCADLTTAGASGTCNGAFVIQQALDAGTGNFPSFIQVADADGSSDVIGQSYNSSDLSGLENESGASATFNHELLLSEVPIFGGGTTVDGVLLPVLPAGQFYLRFALDINENNSKDVQGGDPDRYLALDQLQISLSSTESLHPDITVSAGDVPTPPTLGTLIYSLDNGTNNWVAMDFAIGSGSGTSDALFYIPITSAQYNSCAGNAGDACYVYLYSAFGIQGLSPAGVPAGNYGRSDGPEEWAVFGESNITVPPTEVVPEPISILLLGSTLAAVAFFMRRRQQAQA